MDLGDRVLEEKKSNGNSSKSLHFPMVSSIEIINWEERHGFGLALKCFRVQLSILLSAECQTG